jgi:hypothetical protein
MMIVMEVRLMHMPSVSAFAKQMRIATVILVMFFRLSMQNSVTSTGHISGKFYTWNFKEFVNTLQFSIQTDKNKRHYT